VAQNMVRQLAWTEGLALALAVINGETAQARSGQQRCCRPATMPALAGICVWGIAFRWLLLVPKQLQV
jgi:hypothetical protein